MKIAISLVLCIALSICFVAQAAEVEFNVNDYTEDELYAIRNAINGKLEHEFPMGYYECGIDIKPGSYIIRALDYSDIVVLESRETFEKIKAMASKGEDISKAEGIVIENRLSRRDTVFVNLKEGNMLILEGGQFTIQFNNESWKP